MIIYIFETFVTCQVIEQFQWRVMTLIRYMFEANHMT